MHSGNTMDFRLRQFHFISANRYRGHPKCNQFKIRKFHGNTTGHCGMIAFSGVGDILRLRRRKPTFDGLKCLETNWDLVRKNLIEMTGALEEPKLHCLFCYFYLYHAETRCVDLHEWLSLVSRNTMTSS
jgi:hypothetical protein